MRSGPVSVNSFLSPHSTAHSVALSRNTPGGGSFSDAGAGSFAPGAMLYCQFAVYGAAPDPATHQPRVTSGYEIRRAGGAVLKRSPRTTITPTSLGALLRFQGIALPPAEPGPYELLLSIRDEIGNRAIYAKEEFVIEAPETRKAER